MDGAGATADWGLTVCNTCRYNVSRFFQQCEVWIVPATSWDANTARLKWRDMLDDAMSGQQDVIVTRYNRPIVAVIDYDAYLAVRDAVDNWRRQRAMAVLAEQPT